MTQAQAVSAADMLESGFIREGAGFTWSRPRDRAGQCTSSICDSRLAFAHVMGKIDFRDQLRSHLEAVVRHDPWSNGMGDRVRGCDHLRNAISQRVGLTTRAIMLRSYLMEDTLGIHGTDGRGTFCPIIWASGATQGGGCAADSTRDDLRGKQRGAPLMERCSRSRRVAGMPTICALKRSRRLAMNGPTSFTECGEGRTSVGSSARP